MNTDISDELVKLGDALWTLGGEHEKRTAMMLYQCGCNLNSPNAYMRLYEAKKTTKFKSKRYPNSARQDLLEAVKLHHVGAIILASREKLFSDTSIEFFYLKVAEKVSSLTFHGDHLQVSRLVNEVGSHVPVFMHKIISDCVDKWTEGPLAIPIFPICKSCKYLRSWDSVSPACKVKGACIDEFLERCGFYSEQLIDKTYSDDVKWNMDEAYSETDDE
jgi:hypothetical protein